ncbi:uncharacterized protein LOC133516872 isoform X2 [Cydia pomonella]|uniref:uncharacterized protein LOC133516872 isoform X2 n=1 Tax=Cydia pomonella TaxID=82600 RepID=UPI002ADD8756|nr:uncharacterized protein LOC133516872 isoform X2 [Cydia pomonella]
MPASGFDLYNMQDARNNFDVMRPTPICTDANQFMGQCQNIHISTNCYYGYHEPKRPQNIEATPDCEMVEAPRDDAYSPPHNHGRKRSADGGNHHQIKRPRPEGMGPSTSNYNPCLLRPTHNNPDISRCLMVHMI